MYTKLYLVFATIALFITICFLSFTGSMTELIVSTLLIQILLCVPLFIMMKVVFNNDNEDY